MNEIVIPISEEICLYIEQLQYEVNGYRNLIGYLERSCAGCKQYSRTLHSYMVAYKELNLAMEELRQKYVPDEMRTENHTFRVDYYKQAIVIEGTENN